VNEGYLRVARTFARFFVDQAESEVREPFEFIAYVLNPITDVVESRSSRLEELSKR
jgi:hypothetical protein